MEESSHITNSKTYEEFIDKKVTQHNIHRRRVNSEGTLKSVGMFCFGIVETIIGWILQNRVNINSKDDTDMIMLGIDLLSKIVFTSGIIFIFLGIQEIIIRILFNKFPNMEFIAVAMSQIKILTSFCFALFISALIFRYKNKDTEILNLVETNTKKTILYQIMRYLKNILKNKVSGLYLIIATVISVFIVRKLLMVVLNYNLHSIHYSTRIDQNKKDMKIIKKFNQFVNATFADNVDVIVGRIVNALAAETKLITLASLQSVFGSATAHSMMEAACKEGTNTIDYESLREFYLNSYKEQETLSINMSHSDTSVASLDIITRFIAIVVATILVITSIKDDGNFYTMTTKFVVVLSGGYFFADMIKITFLSIVFIFIVRPFEVNDVVKVNNVLYTVDEMNILTTTFLQNKIRVKSPNYKLFEQPITNFRASKNYEMEYRLRFKAKDFRDKKEKLLDLVREYVRSNPRTFKKTVYYKSINLVEAKGIEAVIVVVFKIQNVDMQGIRKYKEDFALKLDEFLQMSGLKRRDGSGNKDS